MIAIPIWLLLLMILAAGGGVIGWIAALERAEETVDRILAEELQRPKSTGPGRGRVAKPRVVTICGSMRFEQEMREIAANQSMSGRGDIVLMPHVNGKRRHLTATDKTLLDALHLRKIDLSDAVILVTRAGYIGESTRREITYARRAGKPVHTVDFGPVPGLVAGDLAEAAEEVPGG